MPAIESVGTLLARASSRTEVRPGDGRSGSRYEQAQIDGQPYFVKSLSPASDWLMRVTGDHVHRPYLVWQSGIMTRAPASIDHTVVAMQVSGTGDEAVLTMVMRDVGAFLVAEGDTVVPAAQHRGFIDHMADLSCTFWGWEDTIGLTTMKQRIRFFAPGNIAAELLAADVPPPIAAADAGWRSLATRSPALLNLATLLHDRPALITGPLSALPCTFLHGDWKMGNLGTHPGPVLVPGPQPGAAARVQGSDDRAVPRRDPGPGSGHRRLVGQPARPLPARHHGCLRLGEGARRRQRAVLVGGQGHRRGRPARHQRPGIAG